MIKLLEILYFITAVVEIYSEVTGNNTIRFFSKPLLMIVLIVFYVQQMKGNWSKLHKLMAAAFFFSWIGDVALMFVPKNTDDTFLMGLPKNENFFLVGLVGFLITHILYTLAFTKVNDKKTEALLPKKIWVIVPLVIYMVALSSMLLPAINGNELTKPFLVPVIVYSTAIAVMVVFSINRFKRVNDASFAFVFGGALLFMFSDSIIAVNKFLHPFETASIFIMLLYITAQYLIAKGTLKQDAAS